MTSFFLVALDPTPENPNPHAWEINDGGPFASYDEAETWAHDQEREMREQLDLAEDADVSDWFSWTVLYCPVRLLPIDSLMHVVSYLKEDEAADYEEEHGKDGDPDGHHIYTHAVRVERWLKKIAKATS